MTKSFSRRALWGVVIATMLLPSLLKAGDAEEIEDHERARQLVSKGVILPLDTILNRVEIAPGWSLLEVDLEREHGRWIYEIEILKEHGEVVELQYDAETGQYLGTE